MTGWLDASVTVMRLQNAEIARKIDTTGMPGSPTWNECNKKFASLGVEMALFGKPCWAHQLAHSFQHCWLTPDVDVWVAPTTTWQTKEENPCLHNTCCWAAKGLNADITDPRAPGLLKHPWWDLSWRDTTEEHLPACWELWSWPLTCTARNLDRTRGTEPEEETHNLPENSKDGWRHSTPRPPQAVEFPKWNNAGIE